MVEVVEEQHKYKSLYLYNNSDHSDLYLSIFFQFPLLGNLKLMLSLDAQAIPRVIHQNASQNFQGFTILISFLVSTFQILDGNPS